MGRKRIVGNWNPGKRFAWCMVPMERCTSKICNIQSIFSPCLHKPLPTMRDPTFMPTYYMRQIAVFSGHLVPAEYISQTYQKIPGTLGSPSGGHAQKDFITICGILPQVQPRSMGWWLISKPLWPVLHIAGSIFLCVLRDFGQLHFCRHGNKQTRIPIKDMSSIRARQCQQWGTDASFDMFTVGERPQQFNNWQESNPTKGQRKSECADMFPA